MLRVIAANGGYAGTVNASLATDVAALSDPYDAAALARMWAKTELHPGPLELPCRVWTGASNARFGGKGKPRDDANRYGCVGYRTRTVATHVLAYRLLVGPIPEGRHVHHRCEVTLCWEPSHLEVTTPRGNLMASDTPAARNAAKTHCARGGHELTPENVRVKQFAGGRQGRACLACEAEYGAAWRAANRDRVNAQRRIREGRARAGDVELAASAAVPPAGWPSLKGGSDGDAG